MGRCLRARQVWAEPFAVERVARARGGWPTHCSVDDRVFGRRPAHAEGDRCTRRELRISRLRPRRKRNDGRPGEAVHRVAESASHTASGRELVASKVEEPAGRHEYETGYSWPATVTTSATAQGSFAVVAPTQADPRAKRLVPTELLRAWRSAATARRNLGARR